MIYIAVDFETTGLDCFTNQIIEIGAVKFKEDGEVIGEYQKLINPTCDIDPGAEQVHKISKNELKSEQDINEVWKHFIEWCGDFDAFIAHNASFEAGYITLLYEKNLPDFKFIDTLKIARSRISTQDSYKLVDLMPGLKNAHRALPDAIATKDLLLKLIDTYKSKRIPKTQIKSIYDLNPSTQNIPTNKQISYIESLGGNPKKVSTKQEASAYIEQLINKNNTPLFTPKKNKQPTTYSVENNVESLSTFWKIIIALCIAFFLIYIQ